MVIFLRLCDLETVTFPSPWETIIGMIDSCIPLNSIELDLGIFTSTCLASNWFELLWVKLGQCDEPGIISLRFDSGVTLNAISLLLFAK